VFGIYCLCLIIFFKKKTTFFSGLVEMLLDRSTESFKECIVAKFEVTKELARSPTTPANFGPEVFQRLMKFVNDGEFYVRGETEVAIEGSS